MDSNDTRPLTRSVATLPYYFAQFALWLWALFVLAIASIVYDLPRQLCHMPLNAAIARAVWWLVMPYSSR